jgi:hypothetical protein
VVPKDTLTATKTHAATVTVSGSNGITATFGVSFTVRDPEVSGFTSIEAALAHLDTLTGGGTVDTPVSLKLNVDLSSSATGWAAFLTALATKNKYVDLDLSPCALPYEYGLYYFDLSSGSDRIVSLVLPDCTTGFTRAGQVQYTYLKTISGAEIASLDQYTFEGYTALTTVSFPKVTSIGTHAFSGCSALTTISFSGATTTVPEAAFYGCAALTTAAVTAAFPNVTTIGDHAFYGCEALTAASFPHVTELGESAFYGCTSLSTASFPAVTSVGYGAFEGCSSLASATFSEAASIGVYAFSGCTSLAAASFPKATSIEGQAFASCPALSTLNIPMVESIGSLAFANYGTGTLTVTMGAAPPSVGTNLFQGDGTAAAKTVTVRVPSASLNLYNDDTWQKAFRGLGNVADYTGTVNENINVSIEAITN